DVMVPLMLIAPVLLTATLPAPLCETPVIVSGPAVFVRLMAPPVMLVALKLLTVFAPPSVVPPEDEVVSVPLVAMLPPASLMAPVEVRLTLPAPAATAPLMLSALPSFSVKPPLEVNAPRAAMEFELPSV